MADNVNYLKSYCPICQKERSLTSGKIISKAKKSIFIYNKCEHCGVASISSVFGGKNNSDSLVVVEVLTDLNYQESLGLFHKKPITADDVLKIYEQVS